MEDVISEFMRMREFNMYPGFSYMMSHKRSIIEIGKNAYLLYYDNLGKGEEVKISDDVLNLKGILICIVPKVIKWIEFLISKKKDIIFEIYSHEFFSVQPLDCYLVPNHTLCSKEEVEEFKNEMLAPGESLNSNCAVLFADDPIARWKGYVPGNLIKIQRRYPISEYPKYRYVKLRSYDEDYYPNAYL